MNRFIDSNHVATQQIMERYAKNHDLQNFILRDSRFFKTHFICYKKTEDASSETSSVFLFCCKRSGLHTKAVFRNDLKCIIAQGEIHKTNCNGIGHIVVIILG